MCGIFELSLHSMIYIASDHGGYQLKKQLLQFFKNQMHLEVQDMGPKEYQENDDFPIFAIPLAKKVASEKDSLGILICRTGHGMCIAANKVKGIRAILGYNIEAAEKGKTDEDANILCLAGDVLTEEHAGAVVRRFLETKFDAEDRRLRRLKQIEEIER